MTCLSRIPVDKAKKDLASTKEPINLASWVRCSALGFLGPGLARHQRFTSGVSCSAGLDFQRPSGHPSGSVKKFLGVPSSEPSHTNRPKKIFVYVSTDVRKTSLRLRSYERAF